MLNLFSRRQPPTEVFTPRSPNVNTQMYIPRNDLESRLQRGLDETFQLILHGESGSGKSWLYKKVFADLEVEYFVANMASALTAGSINSELNSLLADGSFEKTAYTETKSASVNVVVAEGQLDHAAEYQLKKVHPFLGVLEKLRRKAGSKKACLVFDNFEQLLQKTELIVELGSLIVLMDDERYAKHEVTLLIVGVPSDIKDYFTRVPNGTTIANRVRELPEVARLSNDGAEQLARKGFELLKFRWASAEQEALVLKHIVWVTDRIPQHLHEYCLELSYLAEKNGDVLSESLLDNADKQWLQGSLLSACAQVEKVMNAVRTTAGRRNQTLYALSKCDKEEFGPTDIEPIVRSEFPASTLGVKLNISATLSEVAVDGAQPGVIRRTPRGDAYRFASPVYRMCLRALLRKNSETVEKISF